jgi:hypothetical protein
VVLRGALPDVLTVRIHLVNHCLPTADSTPRRSSARSTRATWSKSPEAPTASSTSKKTRTAESEAIQTRVDQERERRDVQEDYVYSGAEAEARGIGPGPEDVDDEDDVDRGDGVETDGGSAFEDRVDEMIEEIEEEIDDSTPAEAMLYARCSAAFEDAINNTDLPPENGLGVMTAALFEAADTVDIPRSDVIETAREYYVVEEVSE